jgi:uridine kinase
LHEVEPDFGPGRWQPNATAIGELVARASSRSGPFLLAIDGRSSNGKSTLAEHIAAVMPDTSVVHTDDVAWWHSPIGWDDLLIAGVIAPLRRGEAVDYRPPAWGARDREGSITVPAEATLVVIEGVGSGRRSLAKHMQAVIWVQADLDITERRNRERVEAGEIDEAGYEGWMSEEIPFQASERTWERADLIVSGASSAEAGCDLLVLRR